MPIKPENRHRYPADWPQIRLRILSRAGYRCEHPGCRARHHAVGEWVKTPQGDRFKPTGGNRAHDQAGRGLLPYLEARALASASLHARLVVIVLTIAHLDHQPENCHPDNLRALCQRHHLSHDAQHHRQTAYATRKAKANTADLFGT